MTDAHRGMHALWRLAGVLVALWALIGRLSRLRQEIARQNGVVLTPQRFAEMLVDENFPM
jgi:hypothetical protein